MREAEKGRKRRRGKRTEWWGKESREKDEGDQEIILHETFPLYLLRARHCSKCLIYITPLNPYKSPWVRDSCYVNFTDWSVEVQSSQVTYSRGTMSQKLNSFPALQSPGSLSLHHVASQKNGIWRKLPVLPLSSQKMKTSFPVPAHSWLWWYFIGNLGSRVCLPPAKLLPCRQKCIFHLCNRICHRKLLPAS